MFNCHVCGAADAREEFVSEIFTIDNRHVLVAHSRAPLRAVWRGDFLTRHDRESPTTRKGVLSARCPWIFTRYAS